MQPSDVLGGSLDPAVGLVRGIDEELGISDVESSLVRFHSAIFDLDRYQFGLLGHVDLSGTDTSWQRVTERRLTGIAKDKVEARRLERIPWNPDAVIGALMDSISCTLIFAPMLAPIAWKLYGIDPVHFGVVFVLNMEIGYLMPPVTTNLFVSAAVFRKPFGQVTRAVLPTLGLTCIGLFVLMYVPTLSKAALNWKNGVAIYEAFPWNGRPADPEDAAPAEVVLPAGTAPVSAAGTVPAPTSEGGALDISDLTAKSMEGFDDEPASAPPSAAASAPASDSGKVLDLNDLTQKAMDGFDDAAPASQAPSAP